MFTDIDDFLHELQGLKDALLPATEIETIYKRIDKISLRIIVTPVIFIDIYANTETGRYDFTLVKNNKKNNKRVFGYDNLGGWHCHPLNNPEDHVSCNEPLLRQVLQEIADLIKEWKL